MLFRMETLRGIRRGTVTLAFRRWKRPTVREGGTLLTPLGELRIGRVRTVGLGSITEEDARRAGHDSRDALLGELRRRKEGKVYRIDLGALTVDPRVALRGTAAAGDELGELRAKLERIDARAPGGPWTRRVLEILRDHEGVRAGDLCGLVGQEQAAFKRNVRKLKALGLTESLETGYRLSPRGAGLLEGRRDSRKGRR